MELKIIPKTIYALVHRVEKDDEKIIAGVVVQQKKEEFELKDTFTKYTIPSVVKHLKKGIGIHLTISGNQVISKTLEGTEKDDEEIIAEAFPNLDIEEFYVQILRTENRSFIAISRKQVINEIIKEYEKEGIWVQYIHLGDLVLANIVSFIKDDIFYSHQTKIETINDEIISFEKLKEEQFQKYRIGEEQVAQEYLVPLSSICYKLIGEVVLSSNYEEEEIILQKKYKSVQFYKNGLLYGIGGMFFLLLMNFLIFNSAYKKEQLLKEEIQLYSSQKENLQKRKETVKRKEEIVESILKTGFSKSSWYINEIVKSMPTSVILKKYNYQPIERAIRSNKEIQLERETIRIEGESLDKSAFTTWLRTLEILEFIDQITIVHYGVVKKRADFEVVIKMKENDTKE